VAKQIAAEYLGDMKEETAVSSMNQKSMGNRIRRLREKKAWTQEHLAAAAEVSVRTVQRAEEGTLSAETLSAIAGALDVEVQGITESKDAVSRPSVVTPILYYEKLSTLDWLVKAFGFEILEKHTSPDGSIMHAELKIGEGATIMCGSPAYVPGVNTPKKLKGITQCLNVLVDDVDTHFKRAKAAKAEIMSAPQDAYGHRRYQTRDPEGHTWYFATPLEAL
jgi:uncharacterized glyoxalase superfamily protein PhnB/DNA-binding XRE family transcriptional regulator